MRYILLLSFLVLASSAAPSFEQLLHPELRTLSLSELSNPNELNSDYWRKQAQATLSEKLKVSQAASTNRKAKNVILFLGDGMSVHTVAATRAFIEDVSTALSFEKFPYFGLSKTYCVNRQVPDSACTATAYLSGVKGNYGTIGVNAEVVRGECVKGADPKTHTESIGKWAQNAGKATGLVTTTRVTHASPAGLYAHTANRDWENDGIVSRKCNASLNVDIAQQLVNWDVGKNLNVIMGGGRAEFRDQTIRGEEGERGYREDGKDLIREWIDHKKETRAAYVWSRSGLLNTELNKTDYLLGLFSPDHCPYSGDRVRNHLERAEPSLTEMTEAAIEVLSNNKNGYFLFVEGGRIDTAHHDSLARKALEDTQEFANAVRRAHEITSADDTLIVVTSDHSHTMTINGYPKRGSDILGLSPNNNGQDKLPYSILSYANGQGYATGFDANGRRDLSNDDFSSADYKYPGTVPLNAETHGGEDVGIFASGPQAHLFSGVYEQSNIPMLMARIANIGPFHNKK